MQHDRFGSQISVELVCLSTAHIQRFYPLPIEHPILENEALLARTLIAEGYSITGSNTLRFHLLLCTWTGSNIIQQFTAPKRLLLIESYANLFTSESPSLSSFLDA
jgi:hypothetical protein